MRLNSMARNAATVMVALAVVLSIAAVPAAAAGDDGGLLGGDDSDDGGLVEGETTVGGDSGVSVGEDGVGVGGDSGVEAGTDGVSVGGEEIGTDTGGDAPVETDGSNVEVGGDSGVEAGTDGVGAGGDDVFNASTDGVTVVGQDAADSVPGGDTGGTVPDVPGGDGVPGGDDVPVETDGSNVEVGGDSGVSVGADGITVAGERIEREALPGGDSLPGGGTPSVPGGSQDGEVPTGPAPVDIDYSIDSRNGKFNPFLLADTEEGPRGTEGYILLSGLGSAESSRGVSQIELSNDGRTYLDFDQDSTVGRSGIEDAEAAIYTVNESGGEYLLVLKEEAAELGSASYVDGRGVAGTTATGQPGTKKGIWGAGVFPRNLTALGPSVPVGPEVPERVAAGGFCRGGACATATAGINDSIPSNRATDPVKRNYPFPRSTDTSGIGGVPCGKVIGADDLPLGRLPGASDLPPGTLPGVPTSLLTNEAVFGLAFGAAPEPCSVTDPVAEPVANPAVEPGEYEGEPEFDVNDGTLSTDDGVHVVRVVRIGPANGAGTADGVYALGAREGEQFIIQEMTVADEKYEYLYLETEGGQNDGTASGTGDIALRNDMDPSYLGVSGDGSNELGSTTGEASVTVDVVGRSVGGSLSCDATGCQPDYTGLPKLGDVPSIPNPLGGGTLVPSPGSLPD